MNIGDIVALVKAGYTKQEIEAFSAESGENETFEANTEETAVPAETPNPSAETSAPETSAPESSSPSWNDVMLAIRDLKQAVQAGNRHTVQMPADASATVEDTLRAVSGIAATNKNHK